MANSNIVRQYTAADKRTDEYAAWVKAEKPKGKWYWPDAPNKEEKKRKSPPAPSGKYLARARHAHYKEVVQRFSKKSYAEKWLNETLAQMKSGKYGVAAVDSKDSLNKLIDDYISYSYTMKKQSLGNELEYIDYFRSQPFSLKPFTKIASSEIQEMVTRMIEEPSRRADGEPLAWSTIVRRLSTLTAVFAFGIKRDKLSIENPMKHVERPKADKSKKNDSGIRDRFFVDDEGLRFFEAAKRYGNGVLYPLCMFAVETAIRKAELVGMKKVAKIGGKLVVIREHDGLEWQMVKLKEKIVSLPARITKTGVSRDVPLSPAAISVLEERLQKVGYKPSPEEKVFAITGSGVKNAMNRTLKKAKMKDFRFHDLRHVSCTNWSKHMTVFELMKVTGHEDIRSVARYYSGDIQALALKLADIEKSLASDKAAVDKKNIDCVCEKCGHIQAVDVNKFVLEKIMEVLG